jgi:hypothetical protein
MFQLELFSWSVNHMWVREIFESAHGLWYQITGNWLNVYEKFLSLHMDCDTKSQVTDWMCTWNFLSLHMDCDPMSQVTDWMCKRKLLIVYTRTVTLDSQVTDQVCMKETYDLCANRFNVTCRKAEQYDHTIFSGHLFSGMSRNGGRKSEGHCDYQTEWNRHMDRQGH